MIVIVRLLILLTSLLVTNGSATADTGDFSERVAPILQRRCLSCHNERDRKGDFSLHSAATAFADGYIVPGDPASSHLLTLIQPVDGKATMPKGADPLTAAEIEILTNWIANSAPWPAAVQLAEPKVQDFNWWSYQPITLPQVPPAPEQLNGLAVTPVDAFLLQTLSARGMTFSPPADRRTLIRRVTYDLTGLPPTPEQTSAFVNDPDPLAYHKLVDRLLASPQYGERWARHWLDVVKYADTCGYDKDKLRPNAWPYRDYVIRSFNEDKPYSRFLQEQIAGDALFPGQPDGILGLGFLAAGPWDHIGHVEVSEAKIDGKVARNLDRDDIVSNVFNTFCSQTVQCARCHHHKFDPVTQENYYGLQAIFAAIDRAERPYDLDPAIEQQKQQLTAEQSQLQEQRKQLTREIENEGGEPLRQWNQEIARLEKAQTIQKAPEFGYHSALAASPETTKWIELELPETSQISQITLHPCHDDYASIGAGFGFPLRYRVEVAGADQAWHIVHDQTADDVRNPGLTPVEITFLAWDTQRIRITATRLAERKADYIFALAEVQAFDTSAAAPSNRAAGATVTSLDSIESPPRWSRANLTDAKWPQPEDHAAALRLTELRRQRDELLARIETPARVERRAQLQQQLQAIQQKLAKLPAGAMIYAAATHFPVQGNFKPTQGTPRPVFILNRGEVQQPLAPAVPAALPLSAADETPWEPELPEAERRARLARWLSSPEHPLVWRSIVNRVWQYHFGEGIVATPNDFGRMGALPSHPELLDWLACQFRDGGQSFKQLHRLLVTSYAYQQSSEYDPNMAQLDSENRLLWRMNRRRLTAEEIRDSILQISGALDETRGGPGYYLFALEKTAHSPHYEYHQYDPADTATHRRSIYRFIVRSQPDPWMTTLDCADSSQSTPRRNETLTPLQALSLLNNRFNLYMAEQFARRLEHEQPTLDGQITRAIELLVQRPPTPLEQQSLREYAERHGWPNTCRILLNTSEMMYIE